MRLRASTSLQDAIRDPRGFLTGDRGNIRRLAEKLGCSIADAEAVYRRARVTGFASAYSTVFESPRIARSGRTAQALKAPSLSPIGARPHRVRPVGGRPA